MPGTFRQFLYAPDHPRTAQLRGLDAYAYAPVARHDEFTGGLIDGWKKLYKQPFKGVTSDGHLIEGLYPLGDLDPADRAPVEAMVAAAEALLDVCDPEQRSKLCHDVDAPEWQTWANPEFLQFDTGLRLEFAGPRVRDAFLALVEASTSPEGHRAIRTMMRINGFLGDLVGLPGIMNEYSYNVALYGTPSRTAPWGWQLFGHHCAVNCLVVAGHLVISPVFLGAEPNEIDAGPYEGTVAFTERLRLARELMAELTDEQRAAATIYESMLDPEMPEGRVHPGDERHLAGAFQDNRVIPYEGVRVAGLSPRAQELTWRLVAEFAGILPEGSARARMREIRAHLADTWFCWIGGHGPEDPFYFRVQNPVVIAELDHHCGVFLTNDTPQPFHVHTVMRTPNGNDYGRALVRRWQALQVIDSMPHA